MIIIKTIAKNISLQNYLHHICFKSSIFHRFLSASFCLASGAEVLLVVLHSLNLFFWWKQLTWHFYESFFEVLVFIFLSRRPPSYLLTLLLDQRCREPSDKNTFISFWFTPAAKWMITQQRWIKFSCLTLSWAGLFFVVSCSSQSPCVI